MGGTRAARLRQSKLRRLWCRRGGALASRRENARGGARRRPLGRAMKRRNFRRPPEIPSLP